MPVALGVTVLSALAALAAVSGWRMVRSRRGLGTRADRATFATLHTASLASPDLRTGLTEAGAQKSARHLRSLLGTPALAITDGDRPHPGGGPGPGAVRVAELPVAGLRGHTADRREPRGGNTGRLRDGRVCRACAGGERGGPLGVGAT